MDRPPRWRPVLPVLSLLFSSVHLGTSLQPKSLDQRIHDADLIVRGKVEGTLVLALLFLFPPVPSPAPLLPAGSPPRFPPRGTGPHPPPRAGCRAARRACSRIGIREDRERVCRHTGRHPCSHPLRSPTCRDRRSHGGQPVIRDLLDADLPRLPSPLPL